LLDFITMRHKGEPPARLRAQIQLKLKEAKLPAAFAELLAPFMAKADDLNEEALGLLRDIQDVFAMHSISSEVALKILEAAIEEMKAGAGSETEEDAAEITAFHGSRSKNVPGLLNSVLMQVENCKPSVKHYSPARDLSRENKGVHLVSAMSDALQAKLDRRHTPTIGRQYAGMTMGDMAMQVVRAAGHRPKNMPEAVRMATGTHTRSDFPLILENALNNTIARRMEQVTPALARAAHEINAVDYRQSKLLKLSASGMPKEVTETGEIKRVTIDESGELKPAPRDFAAIIGLSNKAIVDDNIGVFDQIGLHLQAGATERFRHVLLEPLLAGGGLGHVMSDGQTVFHASHSNLASSGFALSTGSLSLARLAMRSQRGTQGEYYAIEPWALVVPPTQETLAQQVLAEINATKVSDVNPFSGGLEIIVEVGLTDPLAWYLIGNPASTDGLAYSFLDGQRTPRIETQLGWNTLGTEFRLVWSLDARFVNFASWYRNPGA